MHQNVEVRRRRKGPESNEKSEIAMAYDRQSETVRFAGRTIGLDREKVVGRVHQLSNIEYNSSYY